MTTSEPPAADAPQPPIEPSEAIKKDHGRAGRDLRAAVISALALVGAILLSLLLWKTAFMGIVAIAVVVAVWELHQGLAAKDIDIPEQPLMAGGVVMVVVAYVWGAPALVTATAVTALVIMLWLLRRGVNGYVKNDEKLSVNDFIIKAVALALREFPNLNASFGGKEVIRHGDINIGIAVAVEGGLLTVVNRNTDQQLLRGISGDVKQKVARAREGKVKPDDIEGSTFSISNMGMFDVEHFIAIINPPEAAILAVGSARQVPVVDDGEIKPGWRMKATISVDHRVSDGAEAAQFMQKLAEFLENPVRMLV
jgi:hypothetical protein